VRSSAFRLITRKLHNRSSKLVMRVRFPSPAPAETPSLHQTQPGPDQNTVNGRLTPKRRRPVIENSDYVAFAQRILGAYSRRVATGDVESLAHMVSLSDDINNAIQQAVNGLRAAGYSWTEIGARLGITRHAAQQRWGHARNSW